MSTKGLSKIDEKRTAGASYILAFYEQIMLLQDYYGQYINILIETQQKADKDTKVASLTNEQKSAIIQYIQNVRLSVSKVHIMYLSLHKNLGWEENKSIQAAYEKISTEFIIPSDDLRHYVVEMNNILLGEVIRELLQNSDEVLNQLYGKSGT